MHQRRKRVRGRAPLPAVAAIVLMTLGTTDGPVVAAAQAPATAPAAHAAAKVHTGGDPKVVRHEIVLTLDPEHHHLSAEDRITLPSDRPASSEPLRFLLHAGLSPVSATKGVRVERMTRTPRASEFGLPEGDLRTGSSAFLPRFRGRVPAEGYEVRVPPDVRTFVVCYGGSIEHPPEAPSAEYARSFSDTPGTIGAEGVYLSSGVLWYPWFDDGLVSFSIDVTLPTGWDVVAQGGRTRHEIGEGRAGHVGWREEHPQDGITLAAARFTEYSRPAGGVTAMVFLRTPDTEMANRYLDATVRYLDTYSKMLGPYPYQKFALVENFWESGLGLPSYTLLGSTVIRLPFIIDTSYPHEILHNWWGNGVFVDESSGNWCEGLTAYQADYRLQEEQGKGAAYRRDALQKYADFVSSGKDFPLTEFRERESPATEAVGYGKAMMLFHMLRRRLGDEAFLAALRRFYENNRFRKASWSDLAVAFGAVEKERGGASGSENSAQGSSPHSPWQMIAEWTSRSGAPSFCLDDVKASKIAESGSWRLEGTLRHVDIGGLDTSPYGGSTVWSDLSYWRMNSTTSTQGEMQRPIPAEAWTLDVPMRVTVEGAAAAVRHAIRFNASAESAEIRLTLPARPVKVEVDPDFDLFRHIEREEIPPALSLAFGADTALAVLPSSEPEDMRKAYRAVADAWARGKESTFKVVLDSEIESLPADRTVWIFGWKNRFRDALAAPLAAYDAALDPESLRIGGVTHLRAKHSAALVVPRPDHPDLALSWIAADTAAALPGLGRKLPHYTKYSYLTFEGDEPTNTTKGSWPVVGSPLTVDLELNRSDQGPETASPRETLRGCGRYGSVNLEGETSHDSSTSLPNNQAERPAPPLPDDLPELIALVRPEWITQERMVATVRQLSATALEGRGFGSKGLNDAADQIASAFRDAGLMPGGDKDGSWFQRWTSTGGDPPRTAELKNVVGILPGLPPDAGGEFVVIGAHYDHLGRGWPDAKAGNAGKIHPGADDNASGVAVLLELARLMVRERSERRGTNKEGTLPSPTVEGDRTILFVAFSGEEAGLLGSRHFVAARGSSPARYAAMVNLDTVGRLGSGRVLILGAGSAPGWPPLLERVRSRTGMVSAVTDDPGGSDQRAFVEAGVPAVQLFTGPHADYHAPGDTADKVDGLGLVLVTDIAWHLLNELARPDMILRPAPSGDARAAGMIPSTPTAPSGTAGASGSAGAAGSTGSAAPDANPPSPTARKVSLGTVPDFAYEGAGVRLSSVVPGSPAEKAGLAKGDVIVKLGSTPIADLRAFSDALKTLNPGDKVQVVFTRDGQERSVVAEVVGR